jgi:3-deoxy-7-phosphoheptulonate synthase
MLVIMKKDSTPDQCVGVEAAIERMGFVPLPVPGHNRTAICITGNKGPIPPADLAHLPGVLECISVTKAYKLVSREVQAEDTVVDIGGVTIGGPTPVIIAGPCSVETEARTLAVAQAVKSAGATMFRAGAFKPRTNPYEFQGLGHEALHTLRSVREETGLPVVSEVLDAESVDAMLPHVDVLQVGTRNMQNTSLLKRLGQVDRPILLKRGMSATLTEWLMAAEYLMAGGNRRIILCERGIRTFSDHARNTLDLNVVPLVRKLSHLPVIVDPSHGVGHRDRVRTMARAGLAAGAQGLLIEAHVTPDRSYTDAAQTIDIETLEGIRRDRDLLGRLEPLVGCGEAARITA